MKNIMIDNGQEFSPPDEKTKHMIGLRTAITILERWKANHNQIQKVLRVSRTTLHRAKAGAAASRLDCDQLERISIVLNMHAIMRTIFENPVNVYGFMRFQNGNDFFNGRAPLDVIAQGSMLALIETYRRIDGLRNGLW
jgi:hypothetical protein